MNGNGSRNTDNSTSPLPVSTTAPVPNAAKMAKLSPTQQQRYRQDLLEREKQASALAAAGMVAESVSLAGPPLQSVQLLQPPLAMVAQNALATSTSATTSELDGINWSFMDFGAMHLDDMDLDFATLFDPEHEMSSMQTRGSGVVSTASIDTSAVSPTPVVTSQAWTEGLSPGERQQSPGEPSPS